MSRIKTFYPESGTIARVAESRLIYGDISRAVTEAISQVPMFKYLQGKIRYWTENIFNSIDWAAMGTCLKRMSVQRVTNVLKFVHGWQHDGQQKELLYEDCVGSECPAGCGMTESRMYFIKYKDHRQHESHIRR